MSGKFGKCVFMVFVLSETRSSLWYDKCARYAYVFACT